MTELDIKVFDLVREQIATLGYAPTQRLLAEWTKASLSAVNGAICRLVAEGKLSKVPARTRGLAMAGVPDVRLIDTDTLEAELGRRGITFRALSRVTPARVSRGAPCAADGCDTLVQRGHLMCRPHWFRLSRDLQQEIMSAFGARDERRYEQAITRARDLISGWDDGLRRRA